MIKSSWFSGKRKPLLFYLFLTFLIRLLFTSFVGLIDDEAYHWSWSQEPMLSYYDHPGLIAWLEWVSTSLLGDTYWGVRLPSFICYSVALYFFWKLVRDLFSEAAAWIAVFLFLWSPFYGFGGYVASPEAPFIMFWTIGAWVFWQGVRPGEQRWPLSKTWIWLGIIMGLGLESKFILALLALGFGLFLIVTPHRKVLLTKWPWIGVLIATVLCLPIFIWNHEFGWPGFIYQFHDRHTGREFSIERWLVWLAAQFLFYTPVVFALMLAAFGTGFKKWKQVPWKFILCLSLPSLVMFYPQPLWADYKPHWPGAAHLFLLAGCSVLLLEAKKMQRYLVAGVLLFYIPLNIMAYTPFLGPWMPKVYRQFNAAKPWDTKWDLSNEFHGWEELGAKLNEMQRLYHRDNGLRPFLAALRYETTAQTYWGAKQKTYMLNSVRSHYTVVQKHRQTLNGFKGQPALVVTTEKYPADPRDYAKWDQCEPEVFKTYRGDELSRTFTIWTCSNFQGLIKEL